MPWELLLHLDCTTPHFPSKYHQTLAIMAGANQAALVPEKGSILEVVDVETSHPGPGEVLVRNYAVAVQPLDAKMLLAGYEGAGALQSYPALLGTGGAGIVEAVGKDVSDLAVGDRVVFDTRAYVKADVNRQEGTWQKLVIVSAKTVAKVRRCQQKREYF
jgi:NADPH:quinone reductase-like Zn-dependent oxidoreductase